MSSVVKEKEPPLLLANLNGQELCIIRQNELPCDKTPSIQLGSNSAVEFVDSQGVTHRHELGWSSGWFHFSIRVHPNLACQVDCVITDWQEYDPEAFANGGAPLLYARELSG